MPFIFFPFRSSVTATKAPSLKKKRVAARPDAPKPTTNIFLPRKFMTHLNFSVDNATSANTNEIIQNRTITFGSAHPFNSK